MGKLKRQRWELFAQGVLAGLSGAEAYRRAGYEVSTGPAADTAAYRLMRKDEVKARIEELREESIARSALSRQWVLDRLKENSERAMQKVAVKDADGNDIGEWTWNGSVANKALELIGTELGMFVEKIEQDTRIRVIADKPMTEEQWALEYSPDELEPLKIEGPNFKVIDGDKS